MTLAPYGHAIGIGSGKGNGKSAFGKDHGHNGPWNDAPAAIHEHLAADGIRHNDTEPAFDGGGARQAVVRNPWFIRVAHAIAKVSNQLQRELMSSSLFIFFVEWCGTADCRRRGVAYKDGCHLYDVCLDTMCGDAVQTVNVWYLNNRSSAHNIYVGIPWNLLLLSNIDHVMAANIQRCQRIYQRTLWANAAAFRYVQACIEIAKRGLNVDQLAICIGPGGVGLSLYTAKLAAMYGPTKPRYFDPHVFYQDEELRTTVDILAGGFIFSCQERPTGCKTYLRDDLLKKMLTGDGHSGALSICNVNEHG